MKLIIVLYANLLCLPAMAQRDFQLTQQRNPWLTANNAAALTTYADSTIAHATLSYRHDGGKLHTMSEASGRKLMMPMCSHTTGSRLTLWLTAEPRTADTISQKQQAVCLCLQ